MNTTKKGGPQNGGKITPIRKLADAELRIKRDMLKREFESFKPEDQALWVSAIEETLRERRASAAAEVWPDEGPQQEAEEKKPTTWSLTWLGIKDKLSNWKSDFLNNPVSFAIRKTFANKYFWIASAATAVLIGAATVYTDTAKKIFPDFFSELGERFRELLSYVAEKANLEWLVVNVGVVWLTAGLALGASALFRSTPSQKSKRLSVSSAVLAVPMVFQDMATNIQNGAEKIQDIALDLTSSTWAILAVFVGTYVASKYLPDRNVHDEAAETAPKQPSRIRLLLGAAAGGLSWLLYNAMGAVARLPGRIISALRARRKAEPAPTMEMPAEMAPTPPTEEMEAPAGETGEPETSAWHPANPDLAEIIGKDSDAEPEGEGISSGDITVPLDE